MEKPVTPVVEPAKNPKSQRSQPIQALADVPPPLDDSAVRKAIALAEANNQDPQTITMAEFASPVEPKPPEIPTEVPQKFLKPDGEVDVEKIQASTRQLDEAIAKKEEAISRTVDDYMKEYNERQTKFRTMPNPERLAANLPQAIPPQPVVSVQPTIPPVDQQLEEIVRRDYQADPLATTTRLIDLIVQKRFEPLEIRERAEATRSNLQELAAKDSRILREDVFAAINAKIASDPDIATRKNPHKAAWLEVKEEMRLGEPSQVQAQPSKTLSPVLGGSPPPSALSVSNPTTQEVLSNLHKLDIRDKSQEALGDEAVRKALLGLR